MVGDIALFGLAAWASAASLLGTVLGLAFAVGLLAVIVIGRVVPTAPPALRAVSGACLRYPRVAFPALAVIALGAMAGRLDPGGPAGVGQPTSAERAAGMAAVSPEPRTSSALVSDGGAVGRESGEESPIAQAARMLARPEFLGYRLAASIPNPTGVTLRYENGAIPGLPDVAVAIQYAHGPADARGPAGARRITVHGHRGTRVESRGMSILGWRSGPWGFVLTTRSDQGRGDLHVVDVWAEQVAAYADQQPAIRSVFDAGSPPPTAATEMASPPLTVAAGPGGGRLRCCDGTASPSCACGSARPGCCSRHGGVCGCAAGAF